VTDGPDPNLKVAHGLVRVSVMPVCHRSLSEQIQFLLGHVSVQTTESYIGCKQRFRAAVNDKLGIEPGLAHPEALGCVADFGQVTRSTLIGTHHDERDALISCTAGR
jgi:hypothetical protein